MRCPPIVIVAVVLLALLAAACGSDEPAELATPTPAPTVTATPAPTPPTPTIVPSTTPTPAVPATTDDQAGITATYYLVRDDGSRPWLEPVTTEVAGPGVARGALEALLAAGPTPSGLARPAPEGTTLNGVDLDTDGTLTVDLSLGAAGLGAAFEQAMVDAVVLTGTQFDTADRVRFLVDGAQVETLYGHVDVSQPVEPDPFAVAPVVITSADGVPGSGPGGGSIELAGTANTFEATVELELLDAGGNVIESTFTTATCGTGCRGEWSHAFTDLEPGSYTVVAREPDPSGGEGRPPYERRIEVTVP